MEAPERDWRPKMADLGLDLSKTAVLAMDLQQGIVSGIPMAQERNVVARAKPVLCATVPARDRMPAAAVVRDG
jgi:hypothetical protein